MPAPNYENARVNGILYKGRKDEIIPLFPGIELMYVSLESEALSARHGNDEDMIQINYCKSGQIAWETKNGSRIYLNPGDFSLHRMSLSKCSAAAFPTGQYSGLAILINMKETAANPPEVLKETGIFIEALEKKLCQDDGITFLAGNEQTEGIFSGFYHQAELTLPYQKLKTLELLLYLNKAEFTGKRQLSSYPSEQIESIREIHSRLIEKIGERVTIDELAREYLINPTTLKTAFKAVYGTSIAAHMKEHRMKKAAEMLKESDMSIAEIAQAVGYDSQSKFTAAFKAYYQVLPKEYKKK